MRITSKGQVTIPIALRERSGLLPDTEVEFVLETDGVKVRPAKGALKRSRAIVEQLRGRGSIRMTTDEIMALTRGED